MNRMYIEIPLEPELASALDKLALDLGMEVEEIVACALIYGVKG